ncbi:MAG: cell division protein ZapA [Kiloniellales bacterium]|nr:cell division protein ZapA [Kiloniellales bacterium]
MAEITLTINNRNYDIACDDGHEDHLRRLGAYVDQRVNDLAAAVGQIGEPRLLVMASLLIADELHEAMSKLGSGRNGDGEANGEVIAAFEEREVEVAEALEACAQRLERIAATLGTS